MVLYEVILWLAKNNYLTIKLHEFFLKKTQISLSNENGVWSKITFSFDPTLDLFENLTRN